MKTKPYYPRPWQIPGLLSGEITRVIVPVKRLSAVEHPVNVGNYHPLRHDKRGEAYPAPETYGVWGCDWDIPAPYQPGDVLAGKEAGEVLSYAETYDPVMGDDLWSDAGWRYAVDGKIKEVPWLSDAPLKDWIGDCCAEKKSPILQPAYSIRLHLRVLTVEAVRPCELGAVEAIDAGGLTVPNPPLGDGVVKRLERQYIADHGPDAWDGWAWSVQVERTKEDL